MNQHEETTLKRLNRSISFAALIDDFCQRKKSGNIFCCDGELEYSVQVEKGKIIAVEETSYDDDDFLEDEDYENSELALCKTQVKEAAYEFYLKLYTMKKGGSVTAEQVNTVEKALQEAENTAIAQLVPIVGGVSMFIVQDAKKEGRRQARKELKK